MHEVKALHVFTLSLLLFIVPFCQGQWTWINGTHNFNILTVRPNVPRVSYPNSTIGGRLNGVAWYGDDNNIWVFGGTGAAVAFATISIFSDIWHYSFNTYQWTWLGGGAADFPEYSPPYDAGARSSFVYNVVDSDTVYIFAGFAKSGYFHDVWRLDVFTSNLTYVWTPIWGNDTRDIPVDYSTEHLHPGGRAYAGGWGDEENNLWFFGGLTYSNVSSIAADSKNDLWMFNMTSGSWKYIGGSQTGSDLGHYSNDSLAWPAARNAHTTWSNNGAFWLFGGIQASGTYYNDVWKYQNGLWTWVAGDAPSSKRLARYGTKGIGTYYTVPGGRSYSAAWVDSQGLVWIFGGIGETGQALGIGDLQDVWVLNTTSRVFTWVDGTNTTEYIANYTALGEYSNVTPSARSGPFCVHINDSYIWFYGGAQLTIYYNFFSDMFSFNSTAISHQENYTLISEPIDIPSSGGSESIVTTTKGGKSNAGAIAAGVVVPIVVIGVAGVVAFFVWKKKRNNEQQDTKNVDMERFERKDSQYGSLNDLAKYKQLTGIVIKDLLGVGNFGEVFRGMWDTTPVALKKLKDTAQFAQFQREAELLCSLKNPYIVQYYGTYIDTNKFQYIVTELMTKGDAREFLIKNNNLTIKQVTQMALEAAQGMAFIHSQNIIHRDLALRNLLVTESSGGYVVKVSDFGMAKMMEGQDSYYKSESNHHPIKWCSIETLKYGKYTFQSDVWAYGILLWELYSHGAAPYAGLTNVEAAEQVLSGFRMSAPENCPSEVFAIMTKCWNENPKERPTMDQIVLEFKSVLKNM